MANECFVTGAKRITGHRVSHSNIKTKRVFKPNLQKQRFWVEELKRFVTLCVSVRGIRTIDKKGIAAVLRGRKVRNVVLLPEEA